MATNYDEDDDFDFEDGPQDVVKQLRKVNRTLEKRLKELEQEATTLKTQTRQRTVKDVLSTKGINPKVAALIPQDIEPTEEAVSNWLNEWGDVFGVKTEEAAESAPVNPGLQAQKRINDVVSSAQAPAYDEDIANRIANAKTADELSAIMGVQVYN
jgi:predicted RNase H-like nuclease (RuvC/YqgF family)